MPVSYTHLDVYKRQVYMELIKNGAAASIMEAGGVMKTAFCGPCFGAGEDVYKRQQYY